MVPVGLTPPESVAVAETAPPTSIDPDETAVASVGWPWIGVTVTWEKPVETLDTPVTLEVPVAPTNCLVCRPGAGSASTGAFTTLKVNRSRQEAAGVRGEVRTTDVPS